MGVSNRPAVVAPSKAFERQLLGRMGNLVVRLAEGERDILAAQALRYRVFHDEMGAACNPVFSTSGFEADGLDEICDHLVVVDGARGNKIVGTYRMLRREQVRQAVGFYSDGEFELSRLVDRHSHLNFLELGRSCVLKEYRSKRTIELLWQGIWAYCNHHSIDAMAGCASFPGTIPARHAEALSYLAHFHTAEGDWSIRARKTLYNSMDLIPAEAISLKRALAGMPPLIKGYLRLGAKVGDGCVIDEAFNTTDVMVVLQCADISQRYIDHYGQTATRFAA